MAKFFIDRPIFAWVIAILISLAGGLAIVQLPIAQYPAIAPPEIGIRAMYPGADARTLEDTVTQVIEQSMNGLDGLRQMTAESNSAGMVNVEAGMSKFSGVVKCDTLIATTVVATSYTPGAGNIW